MLHQVNLIGRVLDKTPQGPNHHPRTKRGRLELIVEGPAPENETHAWDSICCEACWYALGKRCECKCGGLHHGTGRTRDESKLGVERELEATT